MKTDCLHERDLILLHYGETPDRTSAAAHLAACPACRERARQLAADLARLAAIDEPAPAAATRIVARVSERLNRRRRWLPMAGAAAATALAVAVLIWTPFDRAPLPAGQQPVARIQPSAADRQAPAPELDLLEQLDLLEELETLQDIEGV